MADRSEVVSKLIDGAAQEMDLPGPLRRRATGEYRHLGAWLKDNAGDGADWSVYPQGSMRLNTVVRPLGSTEYDLDTVAQLDLDLGATTKQELIDVVGETLERYVEASSEREGAPSEVVSKRRCHTLLYKGEPFHFDVLPAVPDVENLPTGIRLTDKEKTRWLWGDPIGYANWFASQVAEEQLLRKAAVAKEFQVDIEALPDADAPTLLHRAVQVMKIHRDLHFEPDDEFKPASILMTTLAALSYQGGYTNLFEAVSNLAGAMASHIEGSNGSYLVCNPVQEHENFADRWTDDHAKHFGAWLDALRADLSGAEQLTGLDVMATRLQESFGIEPIRKSAQRYGLSMTEARKTGNLAVAAGGTLVAGAAASTAGRVNVRDHVFHGA